MDGRSCLDLRNSRVLRSIPNGARAGWPTALLIEVPGWPVGDSIESRQWSMSAMRPEAWPRKLHLPTLSKSIILGKNIIR